jgi:hypothetical protein
LLGRPGGPRPSFVRAAEFRLWGLLVPVIASFRFLIHDRDSRYGAGFDHRIDRVPWRGVAEWPPRSSGMGRIGQLAIAGKLTAGSLPNGAMVSSVMYRPRWTAHGDVAEWLKAVC